MVTTRKKARRQLPRPRLLPPARLPPAPLEKLLLPVCSSAFDSSIQLNSGRKLGFAQYGDPTGYPIIYCHGGLSSRVDIKWADELCRTIGMRVIAVDRPGIGNSARQPGRRLLDFADDISQLIAKLSVENVSILGWSLGAPYALSCGFALRKQVTNVGIIGGIGPVDEETIKSLGMEEDKWLLTYPPLMSGPLQMMLDSLRLAPPAVLRLSLLGHVSNESDRHIIRGMSDQTTGELFREALKQGGIGVLDDYDAVRYDWGFSLSDLSCPVYAWQGTADNICPPSISKRIVEACKSAVYLPVQDCGHFLLHERLPEILQTLRNNAVTAH